MDLRHPSRQTGTMWVLSSGWTGAICKSMDTHWISMALASLGRLGSWTIFTLQVDWDSVGQCEMDWDNAYPLDLHHVFPSSNSPLHEHVLSFTGSGCCSSAGALSFAQVVGHPLTSQKELCLSQEGFFFWMLHGSTKVVVRAVALLSAKTKDKVANSLKKCFRESNILETNKQQTPTT